MAPMHLSSNLSCYVIKIAKKPSWLQNSENNFQQTFFDQEVAVSVKCCFQNVTCFLQKIKLRKNLHLR